MTLDMYTANVLNHVNTLRAIHKRSTPETWPSLLKEHLEEIGMAELSFLEY